MGGLAGVRRGRTAGDLTGGGGRSVEAVRRGGDPRRSGLSRAIGRYYGPPPPGGGYSGGVIPSFQGGGRTGYAPSSYTSPVDQYGRSWGFKRRHLGKSFDPRVQTKATQYALQNYWGQPPGGGYSGGVIPRFQSGDRIRPRFDQFGNRRPVKIRNPNQLGDPGLLEHWQNTNAARRATVAAARRANQAQQQASRSPGGWQAGGAVAPTNLGPLPGSPAAQPGYVSPYPSGWGPFESTYGIIPRRPSQRQMQMQAAHRGRGPGGWQTGGQFPEASFPVENQLADESPWYPDEEVGYEEAVPMQGGFDVFGRGGG